MAPVSPASTTAARPPVPEDITKTPVSGEAVSSGIWWCLRRPRYFQASETLRARSWSRRALAVWYCNAMAAVVWPAWA